MVAVKVVQFVHVVDGEGDPIAGFEHPVPETWLGTDLLPEGAKRAPQQRDGQAEKRAEADPAVPGQAK